MRSCASQLRVSLGGVVGFDFPAVLQMASLAGADSEIASALLPFADQGLRAALNKKQADR